MPLTHERRVVAYRDERLAYPLRAPFDPAEAPPEYPFASNRTDPQNAVYAAVREVLHLAGLDADHFGSPAWNPLGEFAPPGGTVHIKPNWVRHYHLRGHDLFSIITHPAVLRPLIDYAFKAVGPTGRIHVMDAPNFDTDFNVLRVACQLDAMETELRARGVPVTFADLRSLVVELDNGVVVNRIQRNDWSAQGVEFDLGSESELNPIQAHVKRLFGSDYDRRITVGFHSNGGARPARHCYRIAQRVLEADLVISVPKLKTHKKTGVTLNVKNMIGINTDKNYIPHYRVGSPAQGGDEFPDSDGVVKSLRRAGVRCAIDLLLGRSGRLGEQSVHAFMKIWLRLHQRRLERREQRPLDPIDVFYRTVQADTYRTGNWWGNDTCWRCALDINKLLFHGRVDGTIADTPQRRYFSLIDGIVGGDEDGPMACTPRPEGLLIAGFDPLSVDHVATTLMGIDPALIRDQARGVQLQKLCLTDPRRPLVVQSNRPEWEGTPRPGSDLHFRPHFAWREYLERKPWSNSESRTSSLPSN